MYLTTRVGVGRVEVDGAAGKDEVVSASGDEVGDGSSSTCTFGGFRGVGLTFGVGEGFDVIATVMDPFNGVSATGMKRNFFSAYFNCRESWIIRASCSEAYNSNLSSPASLPLLKASSWIDSYDNFVCSKVSANSLLSIRRSSFKPSSSSSFF